VPLRVRVCERDQVVAGQLRGFAVNGVTWPVMVTLVDGEIVAFPGVCPHDDVSLVDYGELDTAAGTCELACRVHGYRFDLATGRCEHNPKLHLRLYKVTEVGGEVWVDLL
jgi:toluene monooxygenase system ferredoxin subunit